MEIEVLQDRDGSFVPVIVQAQALPGRDRSDRAVGVCARVDDQGRSPRTSATGQAPSPCRQGCRAVGGGLIQGTQGRGLGAAVPVGRARFDRAGTLCKSRLSQVVPVRGLGGPGRCGSRAPPGHTNGSPSLCRRLRGSGRFGARSATAQLLSWLTWCRGGCCWGAWVRSGGRGTAAVTMVRWASMDWRRWW